MSPALRRRATESQIAERDVAVLAQLGPVLLHGAGDGAEAFIAQLVVCIFEPAFRFLDPDGLALGLLRPAPQRQPQGNRVRCGPPRSLQPLELRRCCPAQVGNRGAGGQARAGIGDDVADR